MRRLLFFAIFASAIFSSCKKEQLPAEPSTDPVFYISGKVNDVSVHLQAGDDNYYMKSSFEQDRFSIYTFRGDLEQNCNSGCGYALSVLFTDGGVSQQGAASKIDSVLRLGDYPISNKTFWPKEQNIAFVPAQPFSGSADNYTWTVTDENGKVTTVNTYSFSRSLLIGKEYDVKLSFDDGTGSCPLRVHSNKFSPGGTFRAWCNATVSNQTYAFSAETDKPGKYSYKWDFGDGGFADGVSAQHTFGSGDVFEVKLTVTNEKNESCVYKYQVNNSGSTSCDANFKANFYPIDFSKVFRSITFLLRDPSGKIYSSADSEQIAGRSVTVTEITDYVKNSNGQPTKRLKMNFSCDLKDDAGNKISITECTAVIAVAYP